MTFKELYSELERLKNLKQDWDSYGANPPSADVIEKIKNALCLLESNNVLPTRLDPSADGGIGIVFRNGEKYGHIEFTNDGTILACFYDGQCSINEIVNIGKIIYEVVNKK